MQNENYEMNRKNVIISNKIIYLGLIKWRDKKIKRSWKFNVYIIIKNKKLWIRLEWTKWIEEISTNFIRWKITGRFDLFNFRFYTNKNMKSNQNGKWKLININSKSKD